MSGNLLTWHGDQTGEKIILAKSGDVWSPHGQASVTVRLSVGRDVTTCDEMWWDVTRCDEMWRDVMRCDEMWWDVMRCDEMWWDVMRCDGMRWDTVEIVETLETVETMVSLEKHAEHSTYIFTRETSKLNHHFLFVFWLVFLFLIDLSQTKFLESLPSQQEITEIIIISI